MFEQSADIGYEALKNFTLQMKYVEVECNDPLNEQNYSHVHPECEIYINLSGDVSFMVEGRIYSVFPGSIIITRPYEYHHCVYHSNELHKHFWVLLSTEGNENLLDKFFCREKGTENLLTLPIDRHAELFGLCHEMIDCKDGQVANYYRFFKLLMMLNEAEVGHQQTDAYPADVALVIEQINTRFQDQISIADLAKEAHVSINSLERHFSETLHMSPTAYLKKKRLASAAEILCGGGTVMDASQNSGFSDYSHFISLFKKSYGMTPLNYKKQVTGRK